MKRSHIAALVLMVLFCKSGVAFPGGSDLAVHFHADACDAKLVGNSYECTILLDGLGEGIESKSNCVEFVTGGLSDNFDLVVAGDVLNGDYGCQCELSPRFILKDKRGFFEHKLDLSANAFECVGDTVNLVQLHGKLDSDKLYGQGSEADGSILDFVCRKRSTACN